jgi:aspartate aminotransferase
MPTLSTRIAAGGASLIGEVFELAIRLRAEGRTIHDLSKGEPDFQTEQHVCSAGQQAIADGLTKYTATDGASATKRSIRARFLRDGHPRYSDQQLVVGNGGMALLGHIGMALLSQGDEVIVPAPYWPSHAGMVRVVEATPVFVECGVAVHFKLTPAALEAALSSRTQCLILCSPNNPTGVVYTADELRALANVLRKRPDVWVLSDDIYADIIFDGRKHASLAAVCPDLAERTVTLSGVSKGYAMTGWRIGYAAGPVPLMDAVRQIMSHIGGSPSTIAQQATITALDGNQEGLIKRGNLYQQRRDAVLNALQPINSLSIVAPAGAFYMFVDCSALMGARSRDGVVLESSVDLCRYLLHAAGVAVVPGEAFGAAGCFRICFATNMNTLMAACRGISRAISDLGATG